LNGTHSFIFSCPTQSFFFLPLPLLSCSYKQQGLTVREAQEKIYEKIRKEDLNILFRVIQSQSGALDDQSQQPLEQILQNNLKLSANINRTKRALKFICCVDGSEGSDLAFKTTIRLWKRHDHIILFHAYDETKQANLPSLYRVDNVKARYDGQLVERGIPSNQILFQLEEKGKYNTFTVLRNYLMMCRYSWESSHLVNPVSQMTMVPPDFILIGYNGRREKRDDGAATGTATGAGEGEKMFFTMGSTTNITFRSLHLPCIICKRQIPYAVSTAKTENRTFSRPLIYIMAIDHTTHSKNGLEILLQLTRSCDTLRLVHFVAPLSTSVHEGDGETEGEGEGEETIKETENNQSQQEIRNTALREKYERVLLNRGPKQTEVQILTLPNTSSINGGDTGESLREYICRYINEQNPDFFAIAPRKQQNMTSLTEYLIANTSTSIVLCKN
jgi:hypothetical protein